MGVYCTRCQLDIAARMDHRQRSFGIFASTQSPNHNAIMPSSTSPPIPIDTDTTKVSAIPPQIIPTNQHENVDGLVMYDVEDDTMVACAGTIQGETGWYAEPYPDGRVVAIYWEVLPNGDWIRSEKTKPPREVHGPSVGL